MCRNPFVHCQELIEPRAAASHRHPPAAGTALGACLVSPQIALRRWWPARSPPPAAVASPDQLGSGRLWPAPHLVINKLPVSRLSVRTCVVADTSNLYQQLKDVLQQFKQFLDSTALTLKPAIQQLKPMVPQIGDLLTKLIDLMNQLHDAVNQIDVNNIPGLQQVTEFTTGVATVLQTAESLLPAEKPTIDEVLSDAGVVTPLPSLGDVKQQILDLITGIIGDLQTLNT